MIRIPLINRVIKGTVSKTRVLQSDADQITAMSQDPRWIEFCKTGKRPSVSRETTKGVGRSKTLK